MATIVETRERFPQRRVLLEARLSKRQFFIVTRALVGKTVLTLLGCSQDEEKHAIVEPSSTVTEEAIPILKPLVETNIRPQFEYNFAEGVSSEDRRIIQEAGPASLDFFHKEIGAYVKGTMRYQVDRTERAGAVANAEGNTVRLNTGDPGWYSRTPVQKQETVAHESFHSLQEAMTRKGYNRAGSGNYILIEGAAEYAAWSSLVDRGLISYEDTVNQNITWVRQFPKLPPLNSINYTTRGGSYPMSFLAIDFLVKDRGGVKALGDYLRNLYEMPYQDAFQRTFGRSLDEFQDEFELYRATKNI